MTECAFALGMAAGEIAKRSEDDPKLFVAASNEFRHCFFAVRMGIRLSQATQAAGAGRAVPSEASDEPERPEAAERPERDDARERFEVERDRDYEPVSLPRFLKSLGLVAANAEKHRDDLPAHIRDTTLPTLQTLLQQATVPPDGVARSGAAPAVAVLARPPAAPAARSRLLASTVTPAVPPLGPTTTRRRPSG